MNPAIALALRRALILSGAIGAAMLGHVLAHGELAVTPMTPFAWGMLTFVAMLVGSRHDWKPRGAAGTTVLLAGFQAVAHTAMGVAPWAFGMDLHHASLMPSAAMLLGHVAALLFATLLIIHAERMISRAVNVIEAIAEAFSRRPPRRRPVFARRIPAESQTIITGEQRRHDARGPPVSLSF